MKASPPRSFLVRRSRCDVAIVLGEDRGDARNRNLHVLGEEHDRVVCCRAPRRVTVDFRYEDAAGAEGAANHDVRVRAAFNREAHAVRVQLL